MTLVVIAVVGGQDVYEDRDRRDTNRRDDAGNSCHNNYNS